MIAAADRILSRLKDETALAHERAEHTLSLLVEPTLTRPAYRDVLAALYGFYEPVERVLWSPAHATALAALGLHAAERRHAPRLERDLRALGVDEAAIAALPRCATRLRPDVGSCLSRALGALYVVEGATLGGRVIARHVARSIGVGAATGGSFHAGYGDDRTGAMWLAFRAAVVRHVEGESGEERMVDGARETFDRFAEWMESRGRKSESSVVGNESSVVDDGAPERALARRR